MPGDPDSQHGQGGEEPEREALDEPAQRPQREEGQADEDQPVVSVLMIRDLGYKRRPAALVTLGSLAIFLALAAMLHSRDKESMRRHGVSLEKT